MKKFLLIAAVASLLYACTKESADHSKVTADCSGPAKSFATDVQPIFQSSCSNSSGCHASGSHNGPGPLVNYSQIFSARADISSAVASGEMPLSGSLTALQKNTILCWIDNGAPNN